MHGETVKFNNNYFHSGCVTGINCHTYEHGITPAVLSFPYRHMGIKPNEMIVRYSVIRAHTQTHIRDPFGK